MLRVGNRSLSSVFQSIQRNVPLVLPYGIDMTVHSFHSSSIVMGRKSGSKVLEYPVRPPSKKQLRKKSKLMESLKLKRDPVKEKIKLENIRKQVQSDSFQKKMKELGDSMESGLLELMRPGSLEKFLGDGQEKPSVQLPLYNYSDISKITLYLETQKKIQTKSTVIDIDRTTAIASYTPLEINTVLANSVGMHNYEKLKKVYKLMKATKTRVEANAYCALMTHATNQKLYHEANAYFNDLMHADIVPDIPLWTAKIRNEAEAGNFQTAIEIVDRLKKMNSHRHVSFFNPILRAMVNAKKYDQSLKLWLRMHSEGIPFDADSFAIMIKQCSMQGSVERAFFYFDEMRELQIKPDKKVYINLIKATGRAPYWVNGYEDIFFDALTAMESFEFKPDVDIYNAVISAFANAGDSVAAEYYFWEMKRKQIKPNKYSYMHLFSAYAKAQAIGAANYGWKGRFCKPKEAPLTPQEEDMKEIGPARVAKIYSSAMTAEVQTTKGGKRTKAVLSDMFENNTSAREAALYAIHAEAEASREAKRKAKEEMKQSLLLTSSNGEEEEVEEDDEYSDDDEEYEMVEGDDEEEDAELDALIDKDEQLKALLLEFSKQEEARRNKRKTKKTLRQQEEDEEEEEEEDYDENMDDISNTTQYDDEERDDDFDGEQSLQEDGGDEDDEDEDPHERDRRAFLPRLKNYDATEFSDPFYDLPTIRGVAQNTAAKSIAEEEEEQLVAKQKQNQYNAIMVLDGESSSSAVEFRKQIDREWDMVEFGRAPPANYSLPLSVRRKINESRAILAFQEFQSNGLQADALIWNKFLAVFADAVHVDKALQVWKEMQLKGIASDVNTYATLIRMYIRGGQLPQALHLKDEMMQEKKLIPLPETYGLLIQSLTHREMIVESLKLLEESAKYQLTIPERDIRILRNRCTNLQVTHPNLPADPLKWVKDVKKIRHDRRHASRRKIQAAEDGGRW